MAGQLKYRWIFLVAALVVWLAVGWPVVHAAIAGGEIRGFPVPALWLVPFAIFGAAVAGATVLRLRTGLWWVLLGVQVAAVAAMAYLAQWAMMTAFLIIPAWQVAMAATPVKALGWVALQTLVVTGALAAAPNPDLCWVIAKSFGFELLLFFTAQALRREGETAQALTRTNGELRSAQVVIASTARDAERLRISRELHDAWGHELTALGLQLEIASHVSDRGRANDHVMRAKGLASALLGKVRDVVATLRDAERGQAKDGLEVARFAGPDSGGAPRAAEQRVRYHWVFCAAALAIWFAVGWQNLQALAIGTPVRGSAVPALWLLPFLAFGAAVLASMVLKLGRGLHWALLGVQVAAVVAMALVFPSGRLLVFLVVTAWQVGMMTTPVKALGWVVLQTVAVVAALGLPDPWLLLYLVFDLVFLLQLVFVFTAYALRRETLAAQALARTCAELRSAQAVLADTVRDAERLRISRELHDAWGHELTALGLQLEIASHVLEPGRARDHVIQAKGLAGELLASVRDVVSTLREDERCDLKEALEALARSIPTPAIHVDISPGVRVSPDQAHALMRCAQEAATNAVRHADASNLWLRVTSDGEGVRLVARNDGRARPAASPPGSGLLGMRERVEHLGGRLAVKAGGGAAFTIDAWLPSGSPQPA